MGKKTIKNTVLAVIVTAVLGTGSASAVLSGLTRLCSDLGSGRDNLPLYIFCL